MVEDLPALEPAPERDPGALAALLRARGVQFVSYEDWKLLDAHETAAGAAQGRPRVKVTRVPEMLDVIRAGRTG